MQVFWLISRVLRFIFWQLLILLSLLLWSNEFWKVFSLTFWKSFSCVHFYMQQLETNILSAEQLVDFEKVEWTMDAGKSIYKYLPQWVVPEGFGASFLKFSLYWILFHLWRVRLKNPTNTFVVVIFGLIPWFIH